MPQRARRYAKRAGLLLPSRADATYRRLINIRRARTRSPLSAGQAAFLLTFSSRVYIIAYRAACVRARALRRSDNNYRAAFLARLREYFRRAAGDVINRVVGICNFAFFALPERGRGIVAKSKF